MRRHYSPLLPGRALLSRADAVVLMVSTTLSVKWQVLVWKVCHPCSLLRDTPTVAACLFKEQSLSCQKRHSQAIMAMSSLTDEWLVPEQTALSQACVRCDGHSIQHRSAHGFGRGLVWTRLLISTVSPDGKISTAKVASAEVAHVVLAKAYSFQAALEA